MRILFSVEFLTTHSVMIAGLFSTIATAKRLSSSHAIFKHSASSNWPKSLQGLTRADSMLLECIQEPTDHFECDLHVNFSTNPSIRITSRLNAGYFVSEYGNSIGPWIIEYIESGNILFVPSKWVLGLLLKFGVDHRSIVLMPNGVNPDYFYSSSWSDCQSLRSSLNIPEDHFVFSNVSALTENKGVDLLIEAFSIVTSKYPNTILLIKDSSNLYGINGRTCIQDAILRNKLKSSYTDRVRLVSGNISIPAMRELYSLTDCYVSPYRAEGFNVPVLEAISCGTPVIVTSGGPTDDFCFGTSARKITSKVVDSYKNVRGDWLEPDIEHLVSIMIHEIENPRKWTNDFSAFSSAISHMYSYDVLVERLFSDLKSRLDQK
jgi:glycosyltransferase involved in cell wall biosynthesis